MRSATRTAHAGRPTAVHKQRGGASALLDWLEVPGDAIQAHPRPRLHEGPSEPDRQQPPDPPWSGRRHPQRDHRQRRGYPRRPRVRARGARHDCGLRGHLRPGGRRLQPPRRPRELHGSMAAAWLDDWDEETLFLARGIGRPLWVGEGSDESSSPPPGRPSSSSSATPASARGSGSSARGRSWRSRTAQSGGPTPSSPTRASSRATSSPCGHRRKVARRWHAWRRSRPRHSTLAVQALVHRRAERSPPRPVLGRRAGRPAIPRGAWGSPRPAPVASPRGSARASSLRASRSPSASTRSRRSSRPWTSKPAARARSRTSRTGASRGTSTAARAGARPDPFRSASARAGRRAASCRRAPRRWRSAA